MKRYLAARMRSSALLIAGVLAALSLATPIYVEAQNAPDKIRLMADTLRARDSGNLALAKEKAEELIKIAPRDQNVQRLLASINRELDVSSGSAPAAPSAVFGQASGVTIDQMMESAPGATGAETIANIAAQDQEQRIEAARKSIAESKKLSDAGAYEEANSVLASSAATLSLNTATAPTLNAIKAAKADVAAAEAEAVSDPYALDINEVSPEFVAQSAIIRELLTRGRAQFLNGDYGGAQSTFREVEARDANNAEAKLFQTRIAALLGEIHTQNRYKTREQMLTEVDQAWERPKVFDISAANNEVVDDGGRIQNKLNAIVIPQVNFSGMELTRVIETLSELSVVYDGEQQGVNIIPLFNPNDNNPKVNISLRNLNLDRILQFVTQQVNFAYDVGGDAVTVQPSDSLDGTSNTITEFFPISRATVIRLTGLRGGSGGSSGSVDPFAAPVSAPSGGPSQNEETEALQSFFQSAGVNFDLPGTGLAFDGSQLIATQTRRNLERMRVLLRPYREGPQQVEIEAKFLEVSQNDLEEVGFDWFVGDVGFDRAFAFGGGSNAVNGTLNGNSIPIGANRRNLAGAFGVDAGSSAINISDGDSDPLNDIDPIPFGAPAIANTLDLGSGANAIFGSTGWSVNGYGVDFAIRALARKTGSDLMSAPKVTVLSGKRASITVAQEIRYPESYGDIESTVSSGGSSGGTGASSISITAGTPQDFTTRNVGVEMSVTPNVENDDTISLILEPRVTEFEGFVEYGGPSVAVGSDGTVVTVPAGFYQPIFSTREISTEVTIFDGATVVMGGLTRDEVKSVNDKVPVLGDIPGVGRLFRSEGETSQKRNLLIFVTANLVSPGGSPARQTYRNVDANSLFQNPTIMTPSGTANRTIPASE